MVNEGNLCPECKTGYMHFRGSEPEGPNGPSYQSVGKGTGFQCDRCGAQWNSASSTFTHRYSIEGQKKSTKPKTETKGGLKRLKNTAKPRRQTPR